MSYEARDGNMWRVVEINGCEGLTYAGSTTDAVADALDVLRAAGWTAGIDQRRESGNAFAPVEASTWARSPWREVSGE